jgi:hypothetical protein
MRRIDTLEELKAERKRLVLRKNFLEEEIKKDFKDIKAGLEPARLLSETAKRAVGSEENHFLGDSVGAVANMIAKSTLKHAGFIPRLLVPFLIKNVTGKIVEKNKKEILGWFGSLAEKFGRKKRFGEQAG